MRVLTIVMLLLGVALATTGNLVPLKCPVCQTATRGTQLFSTNNAAGADRDLLERAGGGQPILLQAVTCPKCHYSADADDFEKPVDPTLATAVKSGTFKLPAYKTYPERFTEGLRAKDQPPAWVSHALIAEQMRFSKEPASKFSHRDMVVVWCLRFEANPFADHASEEAWKLILEKVPLNPGESRNRADAEVAAARKAVADLSAFPAEKRQMVAGTAAFLLRSHGENVDLLKFLEAYQPEGPMADNWRSVVEETRQVVALERTYQEKALASLQDAIAQRGQDDQVVLTYLCGELLRRMGKNADARAYYDKASMMKPPEWLQDWIGEQIKLVSP